MKNKFYIGFVTDYIGLPKRQVFGSPVTPTRESHGDKYASTWGPFPSRKIALWVSERCINNPHMTDVASAVRCYKANNP